MSGKLLRFYLAVKFTLAGELCQGESGERHRYGFSINSNSSQEFYQLSVRNAWVRLDDDRFIHNAQSRFGPDELAKTKIL